jgi:hypothetical protein
VPVYYNTELITITTVKSFILEAIALKQILRGKNSAAFKATDGGCREY